ncbi:hypothetical protein MKX01_017318, partial [Papaver californicum]
WNPFRSKLAAAILGVVDNIWIVHGARVLYLGAASGTTVSHVSDLVGPISLTGGVYAVEFSHRSERDLVNMAKKRTNVIPIIEDARHPAKYRMLVGMVDVIFSDVAQPDQIFGSQGEEFYFHTVDCVLGSSSGSECESSEESVSRGTSGGFDYRIWTNDPGCVNERRRNFLQGMGKNIIIQ